MIAELIKERNIPKLISRDEMLDILRRAEYGYLPLKPEKLFFEVKENITDKCRQGSSQ